MTSSHIGLLKQKKMLAKKTKFNSLKLGLYTNMVAVPLFWSTDMATVMSNENALLDSCGTAYPAVTFVT